jgi:putative MATE family efflux protein
MKSRNEINMSEGKLTPKLLAFAVPLMLSSVLQQTFNAVDLVIMGHFAGGNALAAVGSTGALAALIVNVLLGIGTGASVLAARYYGARDIDSLQQMVQTAMLVALIGGAVVGALGAVFSKPLLRMMGSPEEVLPLAALYLKIYFMGMPVMMLYNFSSAVLRAVGDTKRPLYFLILAGILHVILSLLFVIVLNLGVGGVAAGTVLSQVLSAFLTLRCLTSADGIYRLDIRHMRFSKEQFAKLLRIGLPAGIQGSFFSISNVIIQSTINSFGSVVMAGNSASANIEGFLYCAQDAFSQAAMASVSQNMGARKYDRTKKVVGICTILEFSVSVALCLFSITFRRQLVGVYTSDPAAIEAGAVRLLINGAVYFTNGLMNMAAGAIRGHGYSLMPMFVTLLGVCAFRIVWIYTVFAATPTLTVLYMSYPISWSMTSIAHYICYFTVRGKAFAKNEALYATQTE